MRHSVLALIVLLAAIRATAQTPTNGHRKPTAGATVHAASVPRTADGHPDFQGMWTNDTLTPLERPKLFENKAFFSELEEPTFEKQVRDDIRARMGDLNVQTSGDISFGSAERGTLLGDRRTSLIVDPPNGKIPAPLPDAQRRLETLEEQRQQHRADGPEDFSLQERCLTFVNQASPPMLPPPSNTAVQIVQTHESMMILTELYHDARIIPMDGRPHLPPSMAQWKGDSRGRWEGDTLVVDTIHFGRKGRHGNQGSWLNASDEALHVVERFTLVNADTILYRFTVEDPSVYATAWTAELPLVRTSKPMFEYACHEGNYSLKNSLTGARAEERRAVNQK
jgi:hypothetical protein